MRIFWIAVRKDLLRKARSPLSTVVMLLFPVIFSLLIGATFGSHGEKIAAIRLAVVDQDRGLAARLLNSAFTQGRGGPRLEPTVVDSAEGIRLVERNKVSAMVRIPPGFTDSLLSGGETFLEVVKNPAQGTYPIIVEQYVQALAQVGSSAVHILQKPLRQIHESAKGSQPATDDFVSRVSVEIGRTMRSVERYVFPPAIRLEKVQAASDSLTAGEAKKEDEASPFRVAVYVLPGMAVFALLMLAIVHMADFQRERALGTLTRQLAAPISPGVVVLGKIGATWAISLLCILILALVATVWARLGVSLAGFGALSLCVALAATGFAAFIQSLTRSERTGAAIGSILVMIMSMVGGSWVPLEMLPPIARAVAPFTLTYWAGQGYRGLVFDGAGPAQLLPHMAVLGGLGLLFTLVAIWRFRQRLASGG